MSLILFEKGRGGVMAGPFWYKSGGWWTSGGEVQEGEVGVPGPSS